MLIQITVGGGEEAALYSFIMKKGPNSINISANFFRGWRLGKIFF